MPPVRSMRIECSHCLVLGQAKLVAVTSGSAEFLCADCGRRSAVDLTNTNQEEYGRASAASSEVAEKDEREACRCPKCSAIIEAESAHCPMCGLNSDKFATYEAAQDTRDDSLGTAWDGVLDAWDSDREHESFLEAVAMGGRFGVGARYYRLAAASVDKKERSENMLARIQSMATAALLQSKPKIQKEKQPYKTVVIVLMVLIILGAGVGIILMIDRNTSPPSLPLQLQERGR